MDLIDLLPRYYEENKTMQDSQALLSNDINKLMSNVEVAKNQGFIETATTLLKRYEEIFGITVDITKSNNIRRDKIKAKIRGTGTTTKEVVKNVASTFSNGIVEVIEEYPDYVFWVNFKGIDSFPKDITNLIEILNEIKPAHLDFEFSNENLISLNLKASYKEYPVDYYKCGTFLCGTKPYIQNQGISFNTQLNANTNKTNTSQRYKLTGTFKGGEDKI